MNTILNDTQREKYKSDIQTLFSLCPQTMTRKINRANVQQGFVFNKVKELSDKSSKMLCVGSHEDTACEALIKEGYDITSIDPAINMDLNTFYSKSKEKRYNIIFSTSVIEHVENDELFIDQICKLLKPNGYGVLTCDFKDGYKNGDPKPNEDHRLYTKDDLLIRLNTILKRNNCAIFGEIDYDHPPDFQYYEHVYSFATYVFKKELSTKTIDFVAGGMMGDFIHAMSVVKNICTREDARANIHISDHPKYRGDIWRYGVQKAHDDLRELVISQEYVNSFQTLSGHGYVKYQNLNNWRSYVVSQLGKEGGYKKCWSEFMREVYAYQVPAEYKWLNIIPDQRYKDIVVIHRSPQRHNNDFPWGQVLAQIHNDILFLTSNEGEFNNFEFKSGKIKLHLASTISEMATIIGSCKYFIGNQSSPFALACAVDTPRLVELHSEASGFYMGEEKYSRNMSWYLDDSKKHISENSLIKL